MYNPKGKKIITATLRNHAINRLIFNAVYNQDEDSMWPNWKIQWNLIVHAGISAQADFRGWGSSSPFLKPHRSPSVLESWIKQPIGMNDTGCFGECLYGKILVCVCPFNIPLLSSWLVADSGRQKKVHTNHSITLLWKSNWRQTTGLSWLETAHSQRMGWSPAVNHENYHHSETTINKATIFTGSIQYLWIGGHGARQ